MFLNLVIVTIPSYTYNCISTSEGIVYNSVAVNLSNLVSIYTKRLKTSMEALGFDQKIKIVLAVDKQNCGLCKHLDMVQLMISFYTWWWCCWFIKNNKPDL